LGKMVPYGSDMGKFYFDRKYYADKALKWVSFESDPHLAATKQAIYGTCVPCITSLYDQLREGRHVLHLGPAFTCWKVVAVMKDEEECLRLIGEFESRFLGEMRLRGRFGSGDPGRTTRVVVFNAPDEKEKERLFEEVAICAQNVNPSSEVELHRGCVELHQELLGDWREWKELQPVKNFAVIPALTRRIKQMLFWEKALG